MSAIYPNGAPEYVPKEGSMTYRLSEKEIQAVSRKPPEVRYEYFVKRVADQEVLWALKDQQGLVMLEDGGNQRSLLLWPFEEFVLTCKNAIWENCVAEKIALNHVMNDLLPALSQDGVMVAVFFVPPENTAFLVQAADLRDDLRQACLLYE